MVEAADKEGLVLHALTVGGGILALCGLPGRGGYYAGDLDLIRDWRPAIVLSLATEEEMAQAGAKTLGPDLRSSGCRWLHLPIPDFGVPDAAWERDWPATSSAALSALRGGGRVLVHCRGGCGRSGMVVLRFMVEAGEAPRRALARLRAVRPCAVETAEQQAWALRPVAFRTTRQNSD